MLRSVEVPTRISRAVTPVGLRRVIIGRSVEELVMSRGDAGVEVPIPRFVPVERYV